MGEPSKLPLEWQFVAPLTQRNVTPNLSQLLRESAFEIHQASSKQTLASLDHLSKQLTRLRAQLYNGAWRATDDELLAYIAALRATNILFLNNGVPFSFQRRDEPDLCYHSDSLAFEELHALLELLAQNWHRGLTESEPRFRVTALLSCVDALRQILMIAQRPDTPDARLFCMPSRLAISSDDPVLSAVPGEARRTQHAELKRFIVKALGGSTKITARLHLCLARRNEVCYEEHLERPDTAYGTLASIIVSIMLAYEEAIKALGKEPEGTFYVFLRMKSAHWRMVYYVKALEDAGRWIPSEYSQEQRHVGNMASLCYTALNEYNTLVAFLRVQNTAPEPLFLDAYSALVKSVQAAQSKLYKEYDYAARLGVVTHVITQGVFLFQNNSGPIGDLLAREQEALKPHITVLQALLAARAPRRLMEPEESAPELPYGNEARIAILQERLRFIDWLTEPGLDLIEAISSLMRERDAIVSKLRAHGQ